MLIIFKYIYIYIYSLKRTLFNLKYSNYCSYIKKKGYSNIFYTILYLKRFLLIYKNNNYNIIT